MNTRNHDSDENNVDPPMPFHVLVHEARKGNQHAMDRLIADYRRYLLFIAEDQLEPALKTKLGASDIVQETMMKAQLNFDQFQGETEGEWKAWLGTILANDVKKGRRHFHAQKRDADREVNFQDQSAIGRDLADRNLTPRSNAIEQESAEVVRKAIEQMKEDHQAVIRQRNFQWLSFGEIGDNLGMSEDGARKLWARAIESLRKILAQDPGNHQSSGQKTEP